MATENTIQINDFSKGMNTDTSDAYLDKSAYRLANNLRFITNTGENSGELHMIEGVVSVSDKIQADAINAVTQLRDLGIIVCEKGGTWEVWVIEKNSTEPKRVVRVTAENNPKNRVIGKKVSVVARYEDNDNQKLYIADGRGPIMVVQLTTVDGEIINLTDEDPDTDMDDVVAYPSALLDVPKFSGMASGRLKAAIYQYSYQMYNKHGATSEISTATKLISLRTGNITVQSSNKIEGYEQGKYTDKAIKISINLEGLLKFDSIRIYRISYEEAGQMPTIECIYDDKLTQEQIDSGWFHYTDVGSAALSIHTLEEYNSMTGIHIVPRVIESKDDYMFAANISEDSYAVYDKEVLEGWNADENVTYEFVTADLIGDVNDSSGKITIKVDGFSKQIDVTSVTTGATYQMDLSNFIYDLNDTNNTYANVYVTYALKSLRRGETYRYGIVLYDKDGKPYAVKHIADITAPTAKECPFFKVDGGMLHVYPLGIKFTVNLPQGKGITRYEIVRCGRSETDMQTITQCVLSRPIARIFDAASKDAEGPRKQHMEYPLTPTGFVTTQDYFSWPDRMYNALHHGGDDPQGFISAKVEYYTNAATNVDIIDQQETNDSWNVKGNYNVFQAISPEYSYQSDSVRDLLQNDTLSIEPICYINPFTQSSSTSTYRGHVYIIEDEDGTDYTDTFDFTSGPYTNIGNEYAKVMIENSDRDPSKRFIRMNYMYDTILSYYKKTSDTDQYINLDQDSFVTDIYNADSNRYSYIKLYNYRDLNQEQYSNDSITSVGFPETLSWDSFATNDDDYHITYPGKITQIDTRTFVNWVCNGLYGVEKNTPMEIGPSETWVYLNNDYLAGGSFVGGAMMGPGGKCFLISTENRNFGGIPQGYPDMGTYLCNIKHNVQGAMYGGDTKNAKESSIYRSYGDYFKAGETDVNGAFVFDGDCFIMPFEYISQHKWYHPQLIYGRKAMIVYSIPMETNVNLAYTYGYEFSKNVNLASGDVTYIQNDASNVGNIFQQDEPLYLYNAAYSSTPRSVTLNAQSSNEDDYNTSLDYRVYHSLPKSNNETTDSWLKFMSGDFLDVDNRYGPITGMRRFHNQLIFWQRVATGILQVNERAQITDDSNLPLILGTGDVLGRFDYLNTSNGMKDEQFCDAQSDATLYWWDAYRKEIVGYSGGLETLILSKVRFIQNILNKYTTDKLLDRPSIFFDKQFNEAIFTVGEHEYPQAGSYAYNEHLGQFTSLYSIMPAGAITFADKTILVKNDGGIRQWNTLGENESAYGLDGEEIYPYLKYVVNANALYTKVFDNGEFGGRVYGGSTEDKRTYENVNPLEHITMTFSTPLKQHGVLTGDKIDNREYNFRYAVPRHEDAEYGDRMRGKTMQVEMSSDSNSYDFSLQFLSTKYRISWA